MDWLTYTTIKRDELFDLRAGSGNLDSTDKWNFCLTSA